MGLIFLPSIIALLIKGMVLIKYGPQIRQENPYLLLSLVVLSGLNIAEFCIFSLVSEPQGVAAILAVRAYYAFAELATISFVMMAIFNLLVKHPIFITQTISGNWQLQSSATINKTGC